MGHYRSEMVDEDELSVQYHEEEKEFKLKVKRMELLLKEKGLAFVLVTMLDEDEVWHLNDSLTSNLRDFRTIHGIKK